MSEPGEDRDAHEAPAEAAWAPPTGAADPDPDPTDQAETEPDEHGAGLAPPTGPAVASAAPSPPLPPTGPPAAVTPVPGDAPVAGEPWTVRAHTAAGVSGLSIEVDGRPHGIGMHQDPTSGGGPPTWTGVVDDVGSDPLRYRFAWRSSWNGDVTEWHTVSPTSASTTEPGD